MNAENVAILANGNDILKKIEDFHIIFKSINPNAFEMMKFEPL